MKYLLICLSLFYLSSCAQMIPGLMSAIDDAVTDEAIGVSIDKAAMQKDTDIKINIDVTNKDK